MITLSGISRFRVTKEVEGFTPYRRCEVVWDGFERDRAGTEAGHAAAQAPLELVHRRRQHEHPDRLGRGGVLGC